MAADMSTLPPSPIVHAEAHVAPGESVNVLRQRRTIAGVLLWPTFQAMPAGTPASRVAKTGTILNHYHYTPGVFNMAANPPTWTTAESFQDAEYEYDTDHPGTLLPNVQVDLFHADAGIDFDDHAQFERFYEHDDTHVGRARRLKILFTEVTIVNDEDTLGSGELVFSGTIDGKDTGKTAVIDASSGDTGVALSWKNVQAAQVEVDVMTRDSPIVLRFQGSDLDVVCDDSLGEVTAEIKPPWPVSRTRGTASSKSFTVAWEMDPILATADDKDATPPPADKTGKSAEDKLLDALIDSATTGPEGRFVFRDLRAGEYVLFLRGRLSFVECYLVGGEVGPPRALRHNGVDLTPLRALRGRPRYFLKLRITADGGFEVLSNRASSGVARETAFVADRLLPPGKSLADIQTDTPYRFYVLPLVSATHQQQWNACAEDLGRAFGVTAARARDAMNRLPVLDLEALQRWSSADRSHDPARSQIVAAGVPCDELLRGTLLLDTANGSDIRTIAFDHAYWHFASATAQQRTRGRFLPLATEGLFSGANHLYGQAAKTKDSYGRYALRFMAASLDGHDIRELKTRLVLWGSKGRFVDMSHDRFDQAVREAVVRFKCDRMLFRKRVLGAGGDPDPTRSVIVAIVDQETYAALDDARPSLGLAAVADTDDPNNAGIPVLNPDGYSRIVFYAAEIALRRIARDRRLMPHSAFRTLAHNREVYRTKIIDANTPNQRNNLRWRLASSAPSGPFSYAGFNTTVGGVTGADGSQHAAGAHVTAAAIRLDAPRGTYVSDAAPNTSDYWAADYSKHTRGTAIDFCLDRNHGGGHAGAEPQIQRDTDAILLFGARRGGHAAPGQLWLEPRQSPAFPTGTTSWIHLDTGGIAMSRVEFVLTDADIHGPRWDANLVVRGRVTQQAVPRLGARVRLLDGVAVVAETYTDSAGAYSLRVRAGAVKTGYLVEATFARPYVYQPPQPAAAAVTRMIDVAFTYAGEEVTAPDIDLPANP